MVLAVFACIGAATLPALYALLLQWLNMMIRCEGVKWEYEREGCHGNDQCWDAAEWLAYNSPTKDIPEKAEQDWDPPQTRKRQSHVSIFDRGISVNAAASRRVQHMLKRIGALAETKPGTARSLSNRRPPEHDLETIAPPAA